MSGLIWFIAAAVWLAVLAQLLSPVVERIAPVVWAWGHVKAGVERAIPRRLRG